MSQYTNGRHVKHCITLAFKGMHSIIVIHFLRASNMDAPLPCKFEGIVHLPRDNIGHIQMLRAL